MYYINTAWGLASSRRRRRIASLPNNLAKIYQNYKSWKIRESLFTFWQSSFKWKYLKDLKRSRNSRNVSSLPWVIDPLPGYLSFPLSSVSRLLKNCNSSQYLSKKKGLEGLERIVFGEPWRSHWETKNLRRRLTFGKAKVWMQLDPAKVRPLQPTSFLI